MDNIEKIKDWIYWTFRLSLLAIFFISIYTKSWFSVSVSAITIILTFIPSIIEKKYKIDYPGEFELLILIFLFAAMILGEIGDFYTKIWWWDLMLHTFSGLILALIAFSLVYILNKEKSMPLKLSPLFLVIFAFCFALSLGAIWEIIEYSSDSFFGTNMQKSGLADTMQDLIVDSIGALLVSIAGFFYFHGKLRFLSYLGRRFFKLNPRLFKA